MKVNGSIVSSSQNQTLLNYLEAQGYDIKTIAVERNGVIIPKAEYKDIVLSDEDTLEIVRFVGGG